MRALGLERHADQGVVVLAADLPYVTAEDVRELVALARPLALAAAPTAPRMQSPPGRPSAFGPSYGPGSAARHGGRLRRAGIENDIDTPGDLGLAQRSYAAGDPARRRRRRCALRARPARQPPAASVTIVGNVGDDLEHWGLHVSPDLDTVLYTLRGRSTRAGLGRGGRHARGDGSGRRLGGADWFILGDRDIGLHLVRSERLRAGEPLSAITADFAAARPPGQLIPATDDRLRTAS